MLINDFHNWSQWSPWDVLDPAMKKTIGGSPKGKGAVYEWEGNSDVGKGRTEITESVPSKKIVIAMHFDEPMEGDSVTEFALEPRDGGTDVRWTMHGPQSYLSKVMCLFFDLDKMIGGDFEKGLAAMKEVAEK